MFRPIVTRWMIGGIALAMLGMAGCAHHGRHEMHRPMDPEMHERMMEHREAMAKAQDRLDALVEAMNAAQGESQVDAIKAVVNEMAAQHKAMHQKMKRHHDQMLQEK